MVVSPAPSIILRSVFSPLQLPGLVFWGPASGVTGVAADAAVATLPDASSPAENATQATGANQPLLRLGASGINNQAAVDFDGIDDFMTCAGLTKAQIPTTGDVTLGLVFKLDGGLGANQDLLYLGNAGAFTPLSHGVFLEKLPDDTLVFNGYDGSEHRAVSNSALTTGVTYRAIGVRESGTNKLYLNGVLQTTTVAAGTPNVHASATLHVGATQGGVLYPTNGKVGDAIIAASAASAGQVARLDAYWRARYGGS